MTSYTLSQPRLVALVTLGLVVSIIVHFKLNDPPKGVVWVILAGFYGLFVLSRVERETS